MIHNQFPLATAAMFVPRPISVRPEAHRVKKKIPGVGPRAAKVKPPPLNLPYFSITFGTPDELKIVDGDQLVIDTVRQVLDENWTDGIQGEKNVRGVHRFKLGGSPFYPTPFSLGKKDEALAARHVTCAILAALKQIGWKLLVASDLAKTWDLSTWFFERFSYDANPKNTRKPVIIGLSMSSDDKFQLVCAPQSLHGVLKGCVGSILEKEKTIGEDYELKLTGDPWDTNDFNEGTNARRLMMKIFDRFEFNGFYYIGTANLKNTADTIYFEQLPETGNSKFLTISLHGVDKLRVIDAQEDIVKSVFETIVKCWPQGVKEQVEHKEVCCTEFNLNGQPWCCEKEEAIDARGLLTQLFHVLASAGWNVLGALDMSRASDKASIVFRYQQPAHVQFFCLAPMDEDKIKLINAPQEIIDIFNEMIDTHWPHGVQKERSLQSGYQWKLKGEPWHAYQGTDCSQARHLLSLTLDQLHKKGWKLVCSADVSAKTDGHRNSARSDVCSLFFAKMHEISV